MTKESVFKQIQALVTKGEDATTASLAIFKAYTRNTESAARLIRVLGPEVLHQWFLRKHGELRHDLITRREAEAAESKGSPGIPLGTRLPSASWSTQARERLVDDPGEILVFGRTINTLTAAGLRDVVTRFNERAEAHTKVARWWSALLKKVEPRLGQRGTIGSKFTIEERCEIFRDVRNQVD